MTPCSARSTSGPRKVDRHRIFYFTKTGTFSVSKPINGQPATRPMAARSASWPIRPSRPTHCTRPASPTAAKSCEDPPGVREGPAGKLYLAYLRDLDGNKICAMHRMAS